MTGKQQPVQNELSPLEAHLQKGLLFNRGNDMVRRYAHSDTQPLRHVRFADVRLPRKNPRQPVMKTAFQESTVITRATWFRYQKHCNVTCCAQAVAISLNQDKHRIKNSVDGQDLADLLLFGTAPSPHQQFFASELTDEIIPCLRPGVVIHADSYRGPIARFFKVHRPKITVPYVLITSKTDGGSPIRYFKDRLDTDPLLLAWYGINPNYDNNANHSLFRMMNLGLAGSVLPQQPTMDILMRARNYSNPFGGDKSRWTDPKLWQSARDTTPLLFANFNVHNNALHRQGPWEMACNNRTMTPLDKISCNQQTKATLRETYTAASQYPFGLSPRGNGNDCYRHYELLLNGVIPIVERQREFDALFQDLPVLQLDPQWNYTQGELVELMHDYVHSEQFLNNTFEKGWERLFLEHWRRQILSDSGRVNEIVHDDQGNEYYTAWQYTLYREPLIQQATPERLARLKRKKEQEEEEKRLAPEKHDGAMELETA
ncbi:expressed unknown protein [Seminavis robusta]|uniref:Uncharacterized protein n=1 Tax=Seminavis robusta TaxID=568900 RepID=A0A9N8DAN2_9STRA|nr:expressed unknown protein [Seminavis robusta]|eukprot:Sro13_g009730.1 n/a (487) ;mRNA; r:15760-17220